MRPSPLTAIEVVLLVALGVLITLGAARLASMSDAVCNPRVTTCE